MKHLTALAVSLVVATPLAALACSHNEASASEQSKATPAADAVLRQTVTVDGNGFHPSRIAAKAGQKVTLVFHRTTDSTCAKQVVFKDLGINKPLPLNQDVEVSLTANSKPIGFACGMNMLRGSVVVQ